ncbi:hypothetical protein, partial [Kribbia dieselivorans]|uniref:hypothetical protein n=1 Tax=Kribbia dieselivorans TaxID=331526 RepID=UPI0008381102
MAVAEARGAGGVRAVAFIPGAPLLLRELTGAVDVAASLRSLVASAAREVTSVGGEVIIVVPADQQPVAETVARRALGPDHGADVSVVEIAPHETRARCAEIGRELAERACVLIVVGGGSARRSVAAPGYLDERAQPFDADLAAALRDVDLETLANVDPALAAELLVDGRAPWQ